MGEGGGLVFGKRSAWAAPRFALAAPHFVEEQRDKVAPSIVVVFHVGSGFVTGSGHALR